MRFLLALLLTAAGLSCSPRPNGALLVTVTFGEGSRARCVRVVIKSPKTGLALSTQPVERGTRTSLRVGVLRSAELSGDVTVQAVGFVAKDCADSSLNEHSVTKPGSLEGTTVVPVLLTLEGPPAAEDADGDHFRASVDCDDSNAMVHPGGAEVRCADGLDDDCANGKDCADPACAAKGCDDGLSCTAGDVCGSGVCAGVAACAAAGLCEKNPGTCAVSGCSYPVDLGAPCGSGLFCRSDKLCLGGEANCLDGLDNDNDLAIDCVDSDCGGLACSSGTTCVAAGTCALGACQPGVAIACPDQVASCFTGGVCIEDAGCTFPVQLDAGVACGTGVCRGDGGCAVPEAGALCANKIDDDGDGLVDCADPGCGSAICDDTNACTVLTICSGGKCDGGMGLICAPPASCLVSAACMPDAGCAYGPAPIGAACPGGVCSSSGACGPFPFVPSNFVPAVTAPIVSVTLDCTALLDTDKEADPFDAWCGDKPEVSVVIQDGGPELLVLSMRDYFQDAGVSLFAYGNRGIVFAVYGNAVVGGGTHPLQNLDGGAFPGGHSLPRGVGVGPQPYCLDGGTGQNGKQSGNTAGGGGGGAFGTVGASGGEGAGATNSRGFGGTVNGEALLVPLRGGCAGGNGGPTSVDRGGVGGGAMQMSVAGRLTILPGARVGSAGYGGQGGDGGAGLNGAAGGGGSGGGVLIEALELVVVDGGFISANAAGGGEGDGDNNDVCCGGVGAGRATVGSGLGGTGAFSVPPRGGRGGDGGNGIIPATAGGNGPGGRACGGGGGGGAGRVRLNVYRTCAIAGTVSGVVTSNRPSCP